MCNDNQVLLICQGKSFLGEPLCVKGIVRQPWEFLPFHFPAPFAPDTANLHLQVYARIPAGQVPYPPHCFVIVATMHGTTTATCRFFSVRLSRMIRALGSPNIPCIADRGRTPGNWYFSSNRLFLPIQ